jgi:hypothetical protein
MCLPILSASVMVSTDEELEELFRGIMDNPDDENQDQDEGRALNDCALHDIPCGPTS